MLVFSLKAKYKKQLQYNIKIFHMKLYTHPEVLILRPQPQDKDSGNRVLVAVGGPAFMVHPIPALETVLRPSNSRAHPREKGVGMALTEPSFSTNLWGWSSHFIQEDTEAQSNGAATHVAGRRGQQASQSIPKTPKPGQSPGSTFGYKEINAR